MSLTKQFFDGLNEQINKDVEFLECRKFAALDVGVIYLIKSLDPVNTRFGKSIIATLLDPIHNIAFQTFLPKRISETLTNDVIDNINISSEKYTLTYLGQSSNPVGGLSRSLVNFGLME